MNKKIPNTNIEVELTSVSTRDGCTRLDFAILCKHSERGKIIFSCRSDVLPSSFEDINYYNSMLDVGLNTVLRELAKGFNALSSALTEEVLANELVIISVLHELVSHR